jgi:hypothetical protein
MARRVIFTLHSGAKVVGKLRRGGEVTVDHRSGAIVGYNAQGIRSHNLIVVDPNHVAAVEVVKWWWRP